jgi:hypothetical protein
MAEKKSSVKRTKKEEPKKEPKSTVSALAADKEKKEEPKKVEVPKAEPQKPKAPPPQAPASVRGDPVVSFERWFAARSKQKKWKPHWMDGMRAFAKTSGRKSMSAWDQIFEKY